MIGYVPEYNPLREENWGGKINDEERKTREEEEEGEAYVWVRDMRCEGLKHKEVYTMFREFEGGGRREEEQEEKEVEETEEVEKMENLNVIRNYI